MQGLFNRLKHQDSGTFSRERRAARRFGDRARRPEFEAMEARTLLTGTWVPIAATAPGHIDTMLLLTDGTVMAQVGGTNTWYDFTPDKSKGYVRGNWNADKPLFTNDSRIYYASAVLPSGKLFVAGGENGTGGSTAEIFDPATQTWTRTSPQNYGKIGDAPAKLLPNGNILIAPEVPNPNLLFKRPSSTTPRPTRGRRVRSSTRIPATRTTAARTRRAGFCCRTEASSPRTTILTRPQTATFPSDTTQRRING